MFRRHGFSLVELLVVLLIFAVLIAIAVPSLVANQPERNLASGGENFTNQISYCRTKAEATQNNIYLAFETRFDDNQVQGHDVDNPFSDYTNPSSAYNYTNPPNPGVARVANSYIIVEERPRYVSIALYDDLGTPGVDNLRLQEQYGDTLPNLIKVRSIGAQPYTYLDWLNDYDAWNAGNGPYPVEPQFPYSRRGTLGGDPTTGAFNDAATPLLIYPQVMINSPGSYSPPGTASLFTRSYNWAGAAVSDQQHKIFCVASEAEILAYDQTVVAGEPRTYDPLNDHPRLQDQVVDYIVLKRLEMPDQVWFVNPWKNTWLTGWEQQGTGVSRQYEDMQFLQYMWTFKPNGEMVMSDWTYTPEPFPDGSYDGLVHGNLEERKGPPTPHMMWMTIEEAVNFGSGSTYADAMVANNRKTDEIAAGRVFVFWPLNGKYLVDDYAPDDGARYIDTTGALDTGKAQYLNLKYDMGGSGTETDQSLAVAREFGYGQNFLVPPGS